MTEPKPALPVRLRDGQVSDLPFIFNSWLKSSRENCPDLRRIPESVFWRYQHQQLHSLLQRCQVTVACDVTDEDHVLGYIVSEQGFAINARDAPHAVARVHWVFVKKTFRRFGLGKMLLENVAVPDTSVEHTFTTEFGQLFLARMAENMRLKFVFNPYARTDTYNENQKRFVLPNRRDRAPVHSERKP